MAERLTLPPLLAQSVRQGCGFAVTRSSLLPQMAPTSCGPACSHPIKRDTRNQDRYKILDGLRGPRSPCRPCLKVPLIFHPSTFFSWLLAVVSCPWNYRSWLDLYPYRIKKWISDPIQSRTYPNQRGWRFSAICHRWLPLQEQVWVKERV